MTWKDSFDRERKPPKPPDAFMHMLVEQIKEATEMGVATALQLVREIYILFDRYDGEPISMYELHARMVLGSVSRRCAPAGADATLGLLVSLGILRESPDDEKKVHMPAIILQTYRDTKSYVEEIKKEAWDSGELDRNIGLNTDDLVLLADDPDVDYTASPVELLPHLIEAYPEFKDDIEKKFGNKGKGAHSLEDLLKEFGGGQIEA